MRARRKSRKGTLALSVAAVAGLVQSHSVSAGAYYWDINGNTATANGSTPSGAWDGGITHAFWNPDPAGGNANGAAIAAPATTDNLFLSAGSDATSTYTLTITGTQNAGNITTEDGAPTITGGTLNLAATSTITVDSAVGNGTIINSEITGVGTSLNKAGTGRLQIGGVSTFTGDINVLNGFLSLAGTTGIPNHLPATATLTLGDATTNTSGSFGLVGRTQTFAGLLTAGDGAANRLISSSGSASTLTLNIAGANNFNGILGGSTFNDNNFALTKTGAGTLTLGNSTSAYSGVTTVSDGSLIAGANVAGASTVSPNLDDTIALADNTLVNGTQVIFGGNTIPSGLVANTVYYVRNTTSSSFKVAASAGGAAIDIKSTGSGVYVTQPSAFGSTDSAIILGNAATTTNNSSPSLFMNGAFTNGRPITIANQATAGKYTVGGTNTTGTATYTGAITVNQPLILQAATGGSVEFAGAWTSNNKVITVGSAGNLGTVKLTSALSTTGGVTVTSGTLLLGSSALSATTPVNIAGGTLDIATFNDTVAGVQLTSGSIIGSSGKLTSTTTFDLQSGTASAVLDGAVGAAKTTAGTVTLSGANTYTGNTVVNFGALLANNTAPGSSATGTGNVTVNEDASFGGIGAVSGAITVNGGGTLSPGASIESLASGAVTLNAGSTFVFESLDASDDGADLLAAAGSLSITGATLQLDEANLAASTWATGDKLTLISYTGDDITSGFTDFDDDTTYAFGDNLWRFDYNDDTPGGNYSADATGTSFVTITSVAGVPEPTSVALLTLGGIGAFASRRRRKI